MIKFILKNYTKDYDGVFSKNFKVKNQLDEIILRKKTASINYNDYFGEISRHHSIEVMNKEVLIFLKKQKKNAIILDVGGGWCWHWRILHKLRPDIKIIALDFIKENFNHAKKILGKKNLNQIFSIIKSYKPLLVYYFPTPKINLKNDSNQYSKIYKKFYVSMPAKLARYCIENKNYFFYPSSTYVGEHQNNLYTKAKRLAENKINNLKDSKLFVNILRIPEINTKQNLSVFNKNLPSFTNLLKKNKDFRNKIFFKNLI